MVIGGAVIRGMLLEMRNPAKMLLTKRCLMGFFRRFALIRVRVGKHG